MYYRMAALGSLRTTGVAGDLRVEGRPGTGVEFSGLQFSSTLLYSSR